MTTPVYIGLGANLGDAKATLQHALAAIAALPGTRLVASSSLYRSAPVQAQGPDYTNAVARLDTALTAQQLLVALQGIEQDHGRSRPYRNAPRTLDLDILIYGDETIDDPNLIIPHPRMHERAFVLIPLSELDPQVVLPQGHISALIQRCAGQHIVRIDD